MGKRFNYILLWITAITGIIASAVNFYLHQVMLGGLMLIIAAYAILNLFFIKNSR